MHASRLRVALQTPLSTCTNILYFVDTEGLNTQLISNKIKGFTESIASLITSFITLMLFYINAIAIVHIVSLLVNKILHYKGFIHIITVKYSR